LAKYARNEPLRVAPSTTREPEGIFKLTIRSADDDEGLGGSPRQLILKTVCFDGIHGSKVNHGI
jgi:hypothetical protein